MCEKPVKNTFRRPEMCNDTLVVLTPQLTELFCCGIFSMHDQLVFMCVCARFSRVARSSIAIVLQPEGWM